MHPITQQLINDSKFSFRYGFEFNDILNKVPSGPNDIYIAHQIASEYLNHISRFKFPVDTSKLLNDFKVEMDKQLKKYHGTYDMGVVNEAGSKLLELFYTTKSKLPESNQAIQLFKRLLNDGRVKIANHRRDPVDGNFYVDLAFQQAKDGKYEYPIFQDRVCMCDMSDVAEALFLAHDKHPMKKWRSSPSYQLRHNTLNKLKTLTIANDTNEEWIRYPHAFFKEFMGSEYVKVTYSNREAYNTDWQFCDYFCVSIVDPDAEE